MSDGDCDAVADVVPIIPVTLEQIAEQLARFETLLIKVAGVINLVSTTEEPMLQQAITTQRAPSYNDLWDASIKTWKLGKGKAYVAGRVRAWEKHVRNAPIGQMPCNHVSEDIAREFILTRDQLGHDQRSKLIQTFRRLSNRAIKVGYIRYCPFTGLKLPKERTTKDKRKFFHPVDEYPLIIKHCKTDEQREFFGFSMGSGARPGEAKHFEWGDVDLEGSRLTFRHGGSEDRATKGGKVCTVPMLPEARTWLQRRVDRLHGGVKPSSGLVFPSLRTGEPYDRSYDFNLDTILSIAGIEKKGRSLYAFRHGFAVALANNFFGDHWSRAEARELMRQDDEKIIDVYYKVLTPVLAEKAARATGLTTATDFGETSGQQPTLPPSLPRQYEGLPEYARRNCS